MTSVSPSAIVRPELEKDIRAALAVLVDNNVQGSLHASVDERFREEMAAIIHGIESRGRFQLLKRFIAHGSLLPSWETKFSNTRDALNDDELASCVDFILGHMVSKFQGKLAEILAITPLTESVDQLQVDGCLPPDGQLVFGADIRCASASARVRSHESGVEGPDAILLRQLPNGRREVHMVAEIKSYPAGPAALRRQCGRHMDALRRGVRLRGNWLPADQVVLPARPASTIRIYVRPARWLLTRTFSIVPNSAGVGQIVMEPQVLPEAETSARSFSGNEWLILLGWSYDALRAAAFRLMHRYMREVGDAIAADPNEKIRKDMSPAEAGENDFLAQLHVAIFRQQENEPDPKRRQKAMELYNVLGFGWAIGHNFKDEEGDPSMMFNEDLTNMARSR